MGISVKGAGSAPPLPDTFKLVHHQSRHVRKQAAGTRLKCLLVKFAPSLLLSCATTPLLFNVMINVHDVQRFNEFSSHSIT